MTLTPLRDDALSSASDGFRLRLALPWIRSLPLAGVADLHVTIDAAPPASLLVAVGDRTVTPSALAFERGWWFLQDRLVLRGRGRLAPGTHAVHVSFSLLVPYLDAGTSGPLRVPVAETRRLVLDARPAVRGVARDVA